MNDVTNQLSQMPKPTVEQFEGRKKLFLVPNHVLPPNAPEDGLELVSRYWSEVRDSIANLERSLGAVSRVYHELIYAGGDAGLQQIEMMNPNGGPFIRAMCQSTAALHPLEDAELVLENTDWQRVLSIGPASQKVLTAALDGYQSTLESRYTAIAERISSELGRWGVRRAVHPRRSPRAVLQRCPGLLRRPARTGRLQTLARRLLFRGSDE